MNLGVNNMRVQTDIYNVYKFDELKKEVQEKVLEKFRQEEEFYFLADDITEELLQELRDNKITYNETPKVYFSLSYCQGDGVMFEGRVYWKSYTIDIKHSGNYYHYNSKELDIYSTKTDKQAKASVYADFNDVYVDICKSLERSGYSIIEDTLKDENMIDMINTNDYEFTENGRQV